jgi:hypothetical protein
LRFLLPLLVIGSSLIAGAWGQRRATGKRASAVVMSSQTEGSLSVAIVNLPDGAALSGSPTQRSLNLGTASYNMAAPMANVRVSRRSGTLVVSTNFGLSVQDPTRHASTATVFAALALPQLSYTFRVDGLKLDRTPQIILNHAPVGITTPHRLEIEVPPTVTEKDSQLSNAILLQVIAN